MDDAWSRIARIAFLACAGAMIAHEIDAAIRAEWRLLYVLRTLPDDVAGPAFAILHLPLSVAIGHLVSHRSDAVRERSRAAFAAFSIVHAGLHWRLRDDPTCDFTGPVSIACIAGSALAGAAWLAAARLARRAHRPDALVPR